jgi:hypothetical protein
MGLEIIGGVLIGLVLAVVLLRYLVKRAGSRGTRAPGPGRPGGPPR